MGKKKDISGRKYGRLLVIKRVEGRKYASVLCKCECGKEKIILMNPIILGKTRSCGCLRDEAARRTSTKHGLAVDENGKHTRLYRIWKSMRRRCDGVNFKHYHRYGGRGIKVCDQWHDYKNFHDWSMANGYEKTLTIDRIDNDGNYDPLNCRWTTIAVQATNKRNTFKIEIDGEMVPATDYFRSKGLDHKLIIGRLRQGWDMERAINQPRFSRGVTENEKRENK